MSLDIVSQNFESSSFDRIRKYTELGAEVWSARDLMRLLGYAKWQNFEPWIEQAIENIELAGEDARIQITATDNVGNRPQGGGSSSQDYNLTRFGCYHVALACNGKGKPMVALAKQYFVVKTRQAETVIPVLNQQLESLRLENQNLQLKNQGLELQVAVNNSQLALTSFNHLIASTLPEPMQQKIFGYSTVERVEYRDRIVKDNQIINDGSTINKTQLCARYGFLSKSGSPDYKQLKSKLARLKIPDLAWIEINTVQTNVELNRNYLSELDRALYRSEERQMWIGE